MEARITHTSGTDVYIERSDGVTAKVNLEIFSEADQQYINEWSLNELLSDDIFDVRFRQKISDENKYTENRIIHEEYSVHYDLVITNNDRDNDLNNIRVEYLILKFEDAIAAEEKNDGEVKRIKKTITHDTIKAREEIQLQTEKFAMLETQLTPGTVWKNGGIRNSKDVVRGIWVKVYVGEKLVAEASKPKNMMRKQSWN